MRHPNDQETSSKNRRFVRHPNLILLRIEDLCDTQMTKRLLLTIEDLCDTQMTKRLLLRIEDLCDTQMAKRLLLRIEDLCDTQMAKRLLLRIEDLCDTQMAKRLLLRIEDLSLNRGYRERRTVSSQTVVFNASSLASRRSKNFKIVQIERMPEYGPENKGTKMFLKFLSLQFHSTRNAPSSL